MLFADRYGPWALVTGAAQGIGAAFAGELATRGLDLVVVDRDGDALARSASGWRAGSHDVRELVVDLTKPDAASLVLDAIADVELGLFVSNAAVSYEGPFVEQGVAAGLAQLDLNCRFPLAMVHALLPGMVARGRGGVVLLSSLSAMRGTPLVAGYAATKAWNLVLGESLWEEVRHDGVDVLAVLPGSTRTPGWLSSRPQASVGTSNVMEPEDVVGEALDALGVRPSVIVGQANRDGEAFMSTLDRADAVRAMGEVMRAMYPPARAADPDVGGAGTPG